MKSSKVTEFIAVLIFAMLIGGAAMLSIIYLGGLARGIALILIIAATILSWSFLRKRFGRYE